MTSRSDRPRRDAGFSLVEAVVAVSILAGGLVIVQRIHADSARTGFGAQQISAALWVAEAELARARSLPLEPGTRRGTALNGVSWTRTSAPFRTSADSSVPLLWQVDVVATPPRGRPVHLSTLILRGAV